MLKLAATMLLLVSNQILIPQALCQADSSLKQFYPLQVGDLWQYRDESNVLSTCTITQDSMMSNGQRYFLGCDDARIDSMFRVQWFRGFVGDTCGGLDHEISIYRLNELVGSVWPICQNVVYSLCAKWFMRYDGASISNVLGADREVMRFTPGAYCDEIGDTVWYSVDWLLVKGLGVYREETIEFKSRQLTGAIIDGVSYGTVVGVNTVEVSQIPYFKLYQNFPNPFNSETTIRYDVPEPSIVSLVVYDVLGNTIRTIVNEYQLSGHYSYRFDASQLSSGVYYYRMVTGSLTKTYLMVHCK